MIAARVASQYKVKRIEDRLFVEDVGIGRRQEIVAEAKALDVPSCTPDVRAVGHAVGCGNHFLVQLLLVSQQRLAEVLRESLRLLVLHLGEALLHAGSIPAHLSDLLNDEVFVVQQKIFVQVFTGSQVKFYGSLYFR